MSRIVTLALTLLLVVTISASAQTKDPQQQTLEGMMRACNAIAEELKASRALNEANRQELEAAANTLKAERERGAIKDDKITLLEQQLESVKSALAKQEQADKLRQEEIALLKTQIVTLTARLKLARRIGWGAGVLALGLAVAYGNK